MTIGRLIVATALSLFLLLNGAAQEAPSPPPADAGEAESEQAQPPQADGSEPRTLEEIFIPSEEIAADEEVTFPINI
jgi:hypothetical protein